MVHVKTLVALLSLIAATTPLAVGAAHDASGHGLLPLHEAVYDSAVTDFLPLLQREEQLPKQHENERVAKTKADEETVAPHTQQRASVQGDASVDVDLLAVLANMVRNCCSAPVSLVAIDVANTCTLFALDGP